MSRKTIRLDTDFIVELVYGIETSNILVIVLQTMEGGKIALSLKQLERLEEKLPEINKRIKRLQE